ncbi:nitrile hydratase (plasmid) [Azospirillum sp. B510]|uniref:NHLP leader peptide family RiPP precursor n=1 Tax=Azospirillum sp. (strain B510) TaxID=137722 RepID=UPI0001C4BC7F|nr:NHLP leader peptide family RiPP precursor [Azospirillum sp. B510]BAI74512.1 nitrile hydratase [Azospirillum sp. B510]
MTDQTQSTSMTRRELEAKIVARAWSDEDFKAKFLADPKAMLEEHLGTRLPETLVIAAHEETADALHFVIPAKPWSDLDELSDEDLEKVAGGVDVAEWMLRLRSSPPCPSLPSPPRLRQQ